MNQMEANRIANWTAAVAVSSTARGARGQEAEAMVCLIRIRILLN